ncbi:phosphatase PAP2 family protein [Enterococcus timonensis]|uniref:phosphatase PAP2 family protein n=1 Tax=Enterococcus timonensis TaxID=1852364 RepID=UPI0008DAC8A8|nr:phosphatase PAP2 family protein [Enterococcus timonensis]
MKNSQKYFSTASTLALIFVFLGYLVKFYDEWLFFDQPVQNFIRGQLPDAVTTFFKWITQFANPVPLSIITAAFMLFFLLQKEYIATLWLGFNIVVGAGLVNHLLKLVYQRPRPDLVHLVTETSLSFPSGHATGSLLLFGTLAILAPKISSNHYLQRTLQIFFGVVILLIGLSRIYLGVHYPSDIIGGYLFGATWLCATYPLYYRYAFIERFKNPLKKKMKR